jgi:hypothetical protein
VKHKILDLTTFHSFAKEKQVPNKLMIYFVKHLASVDLSW